MVVIKDYSSQETIRILHPSEFVMLPQLGDKLLLPKHPQVLKVQAVYHRLIAREMVLVTTPEGEVNEYSAPVSWS